MSLGRSKTHDVLWMICFTVKGPLQAGISFFTPSNVWNHGCLVLSSTESPTLNCMSLRFLLAEVAMDILDFSSTTRAFSQVSSHAARCCEEDDGGRS